MLENIQICQHWMTSIFLLYRDGCYIYKLEENNT